MFDATDILKVMEEAECEMKENTIEIPLVSLKIPVKQVVKKSVKLKCREK